MPKDTQTAHALTTAAHFLLKSGRAASAETLLAELAAEPKAMPRIRLKAQIAAQTGTARPDPSDWARHGTIRRQPPSCMTILDPISDLNWSGAFATTRFEREAALQQATRADFDFVLIESIWSGHASDWRYACTSPGLKHANAQALLRLLEYLRRSADAPIVMINKEDPLHFEKFLPVMQYADHIFTTDEDMVAEYRARTNALSVTALPFAANMALTNPVNRVRKPQGSLCFAGSYYSEGHEERARQMEFMLEPIVDFDGTIYDRMSAQQSPRYQFPERFRPFIRPAVDFAEMTQLYRRFKVFLNVNTIVTSPTMMARRVYELLASGTPVVSAPSKALERYFPGIVATATTAQEARREVGRLLENERHWWKTSQKGIREVALHHQYAHRGALIREIALGQSTDLRRPLATIVTSTKRWTFLDRIVENIARQTYPRIEVVFALRESWPDDRIAELVRRISAAPNIENVTVLRFSENVSLGSKLNAAVEAAQGEFVAKFDDDDWYFPNYLQDMILTFDFSGADLAGKWTFPVWLEGSDTLLLRNPGHEHVHPAPFIAGATFVCRKSWLEKLPFADRSQGEDTDLIKRTKAAGGTVYSADHFNFIQYRAADLAHHTWRVDDDQYKQSGKLIGGRKDFHDFIV
ncbi:glycosyltransferase [Sinisalibacter lacisalsi]|uniref:Glycosyl transferase n=1 Tax=Sinisalibacter lacisalsi TaxID=1526570 RepID=A0ABQ1QQ02_9RHOB|nr:glycosyltransferase [Sinisalibacter lacisalsi]GGD36014.1 glycosyl transferase [Sinisalibacter lacisalsi]